MINHNAVKVEEKIQNGQLVEDEVLRSFEDELRANSFCSHWQNFWGRIRTPELDPFVWSWKSLSEFLNRSGSLVDIGRADDPNDRRTIALVNPSLEDIGRASRTLDVCAQLVKPGESAEAHRHAMNAMRFVVESAGDMYTTVNGDKITMEPGDLCLTPNWSWHDHTNRSDTSAIWLDILDSSLCTYMGGSFKDNWTDGVLQPILHDDGDCHRRFSPIRPYTAREENGPVPYVYKWLETERTLMELYERGEVDAHEGAYVDYVHPLTGGPTFQTMHCRMHLLPPHSVTLPIRRTGVTFYHALRGEGLTVVGQGEQTESRRTPSRADENVELKWGTKDCLLVPTWRWQHHRNDSDVPVFLFSVTDSPSLDALGWHREELGSQNS